MKFGDKKLYLAKRIATETDDYGNEITYYDKIKRYYFNYMPTAGQVDYQIYGSLINNMYTSYLPVSYLGVIKSGDIAYLKDGETQNIDELVALDENDKYCQHANYRVRIVLPQNMRIKVIFEKIKKQ